LEFFYVFTFNYIPDFLAVLFTPAPLPCPFANLMILWSEQFSWSLTSHSSTAVNNWLLITVKSILMEPRLLRKVVRVLSSFIMCRCLLMRNSSRILPLVLVRVSCHDVDLELLSIAMITPAPLACCIIASILLKSSSICRFMSKSYWL